MGNEDIDNDENDDIDNLPHPVMKYNPAYSSVKSNACAQCCFIFSFMGIVFLSIIALMLKSDSIYIKISQANDDKKPELADGVMGAVYIYIVCFLVSGFMVFKNKGVKTERLDPRTTL